MDIDTLYAIEAWIAPYWPYIVAAFVLLFALVVAILAPKAVKAVKSLKTAFPAVPKPNAELDSPGVAVVPAEIDPTGGSVGKVAARFKEKTCVVDVMDHDRKLSVVGKYDDNSFTFDYIGESHVVRRLLDEPFRHTQIGGAYYPLFVWDSIANVQLPLKALKDSLVKVIADVKSQMVDDYVSEPSLLQAVKDSFMSAVSIAHIVNGKYIEAVTTQKEDWITVIAFAIMAFYSGMLISGNKLVVDSSWSPFVMLLLLGIIGYVMSRKG
ncbi:MAG: hypothetical protein PHH26_01965 [Candidatus Thermoplasmatota archaeon]|nr:hypothetical protein [Candidatus Thermoplasmatota archaeon]